MSNVYRRSPSSRDGFYLTRRSKSGEYLRGMADGICKCRERERKRERDGGRLERAREAARVIVIETSLSATRA